MRLFLLAPLELQVEAYSDDGGTSDRVIAAKGRVDVASNRRDSSIDARASCGC